MLMVVCADFELCNESETADSTCVCATEHWSHNKSRLFPRNSVWGKLRLERKLTSSVLLGSLASWHSTGRRLRLCLWVPCRSTRLWRRQGRRGNKQEEDYGIIMGTLWAIHGCTGLRDSSEGSQITASESSDFDTARWMALQRIWRGRQQCCSCDSLGVQEDLYTFQIASFSPKKQLTQCGSQDLATATLKVFRETLIEQAEQGVDYWPGFQEHWSITCSSWLMNMREIQFKG